MESRKDSAQPVKALVSKGDEFVSGEILSAPRKRGRPRKKEKVEETNSSGNGSTAIEAEKKEMHVPLDLIDEPSSVHRRAFDEGSMRRLEKSIRTFGLMQPILVAKKRNRYEIVFGHRRFLATRNIGRLSIRAYVADKISQVSEAMKFAENDVRDDLSQLEKAFALAQMKERAKCSNRDLATMTGLSEQSVGQYLAILDWPTCLKDALADEVLSFTAARELVKIENEESLANYVYFARESGCTPRLAVQWRAEYEAQKNYLARQNDSSGGTPDMEVPAEALGECFVSGERIPFSQLTPVWMKPDLKKYLADVLRAAQDTE